MTPSNPKFPAVDSATHAAVLQACFELGSTEHIGLCDLDWYPSWLAKQLSKTEQNVLQYRLRWALLCEDWAAEDGVDKKCSSPLNADFLNILHAVRRNAGESSIDHIIDALIHDGVFKENEGSQATDLTRGHIVFAMLGWLSMLYVPSFNDFDDVKWEIHHDPNQPNSRLIYDTYEVNNYHYMLAVQEPASFLRHFGNLLPARRRDTGQKDKIASSWSPISPTKFNIQVLSNLLRIRVQWVDTLALHLDYDQTTRTLSLFRYPSFCVNQCRNYGVIYSFASSERRSADPRADSDDITSFLEETLLSFRLLFGQSKAGRKHFRRLFKSSPELQENGDKLLFVLCAESRIEHAIVPKDRPIFFLDRDFPVLGGRIKLLIEDMKESRPQGWRQLLRDRRDTVQYWTFWLVAIFGAVSIMLSMIQVILAGLALR